MSDIKYPWYEVVTGDALMQGDIIKNCKIIEPVFEANKEADYGEDIKKYFADVIIVSQSCDLTNDKIEFVNVSPFETLSEYQNEVDKNLPEPENKKARLSRWNKLREGLIIGFHMLDEYKIIGQESEHLVINFHYVYSIPINYLKYQAVVNGERLRLLPPYREHLAQAFAKFFMRVGLPSDIPKFE
jgi:hypothetical protein